MREIKFRAWDEADKTMREVSNINWYDEHVYMDETPMTSERRALANVVLMQYTGLKSKSGVEIYEGDIIEIRTRTLEIDPVTRKVPARPGSDVIPVKWVNMMAAFNIRPNYILNNEEYEILGNIYEHSYLLDKNS